MRQALGKMPSLRLGKEARIETHGPVGRFLGDLTIGDTVGHGISRWRTVRHCKSARVRYLCTVCGEMASRSAIS